MTLSAHIRNLALILLPLTLVCCRLEDGTVGTVNDLPISERFFTMQLKMAKAEVFAKFFRDFGNTDAPDFWTNTRNGPSPLEIAKKKALERTVLILCQLQLAVHLKLLDNPSYAAFLDRWKNENKRRETAIALGKVIYGPVNYSEENYFNYEFGNIVIAMVDKLQSNVLAIKDQEVIHFFKSQAIPELKINAHNMEKARKYLINEKYEKFIEHTASMAHIVINKPLWEHIVMP